MWNNRSQAFIPSSSRPRPCRLGTLIAQLTLGPWDGNIRLNDPHDIPIHAGWGPQDS